MNDFIDAVEFYIHAVGEDADGSFGTVLGGLGRGGVGDGLAVGSFEYEGYSPVEVIPTEVFVIA